MEKIDAIMHYDWDRIIVGIIKGLQNFIEKFNKYFPKSYYNFEDPAEYEF